MSQSFAQELSGVEKSHNLAVSLERAFDYARDGGLATVMLEHLLLALSEDSEAVGVLSACNVDLDRLRTDVAGHLGRMNGQSQGGQNEEAKPGQEPLADPLLLTIIRHASAAAQKSGRPQLNGAIVLAAIIGDGKSNAAQILEGQGLTFQGTLRALQAQGKPDASAAQPSPGQVASAKQAAPSPAPPPPEPAASPAPGPSQSPSPAAGPMPSSTAGPASTQSPRPEPERVTAGASQSVDDILGSVRERIKSKGVTQAQGQAQVQPDRVPFDQVKQGQQARQQIAPENGPESDGFPKILQQQAAEKAQSQSQPKSQSSSAPESQKPARGAIGEGMPKIVTERMKKEPADGPAPAPTPAPAPVPAQELIRKPSPAPAVAAKPPVSTSSQPAPSARIPAPAPAPAVSQQPKPAPSPAPSPAPAPQPSTDAAPQPATRKQMPVSPPSGGQTARARPVRPVGPPVQTDKWARAIDGKPAAPAVQQTPQAPQPIASAQTPARAPAPSPSTAPPSTGAGSAASEKSNGQSGTTASAYTGTYPQIAQADRSGLVPASKGAGGAAPGGNKMGSAPQSKPAPTPAPARDQIAAQNTGPPIEPWPEPRDPNIQPPPGAPQQLPSGGLAGQGPGNEMNPNPAGAPYLSAEELNAAPAGAGGQYADRGKSVTGANPRGGVPAAGAAVAGKRKSGTQVGVGQLVENIPRFMRVAIPATIEVRIARDKVEALSEGMQGHAPVQRHDLFITKAMTVKLRAPDGGFWIETASPETQWIENTLGLLHDEFASWRWTITPRTRGSKRLQLVVSARTVGKDGLAAETPLPDQMITVKVRVNYRRLFKKFGGWVIAALLGGAISTVGSTLAGGGNSLRALLAMIGL